ncbi:hypothetical protein DF019_02445 [Burkholderia cenocepacia]|nr:hypothetical protein DF019_02445 [Burkholderia cenocepacia]
MKRRKPRGLRRFMRRMRASCVGAGGPGVARRHAAVERPTDHPSHDRMSLGTTSIYVSPEEARMRREAAKYHARLTRDV